MLTTRGGKGGLRDRELGDRRPQGHHGPPSHADLYLPPGPRLGDSNLGASSDPHVFLMAQVVTAPLLVGGQIILFFRWPHCTLKKTSALALPPDSLKLFHRATTLIYGRICATQ